MPCPTRIITAEERLAIIDRIRAGANADDLAAHLNMPVERVGRMFRRDIAYHSAEAKHEVLSKLYEAAISGKNMTASIFSAKSRYGWRETGAREHQSDTVWPRIVVDINASERSA
jgi:hypothetical protein